jgi:hypothetical protein
VVGGGKRSQYSGTGEGLSRYPKGVYGKRERRLSGCRAG